MFFFANFRPPKEEAMEKDKNKRQKKMEGTSDWGLILQGVDGDMWNTPLTLSLVQPPVHWDKFVDFRDVPDFI